MELVAERRSDPANLEEKLREEQRREGMWDPLERWRAIQQTIAWADAQKKGGRNVPANRLREEKRKLQELREWQENRTKA